MVKLTIEMPEDASQLIAKAVVKGIIQEIQDQLDAKTIGIDEFRLKYCRKKGRAWVDRFIIKKYKPDWCPNPNPGPGHKVWVYEYPAARWMEKHKKEINWEEKYHD
ncbi:MAG: hypothetical protein J6565_08075 [Lactobacillus sp.]|nr:hypothetical protein [Lactobacillus sp.]